jgi:hypothetical protein
MTIFVGETFGIWQVSRPNRRWVGNTSTYFKATGYGDRRSMKVTQDSM